jgi:hypothetical protein
MLDLSNNSFSGHIAPEIGALSNLGISLDLSSNRFIGELPDEMSGLTQLQSQPREQWPLRQHLGPR